AVDKAVADIAERQIVPLLDLALNSADEPRTPVALQRKDREKFSLIERAIQLAIHRASARLDIGYIEYVRVRAAWKSDLQGIAHGRVCAIAASDEGCHNSLLRPVRSLQARHHPPVLLFETDQLYWTLHLETQGPETIDQKALMFVLRKYERIRKGTYALPHIAEDASPLQLACDPEVGGTHLKPAINDFAGEPYLIVKFEDARMHRQCPRGRARLGGLVDDAHLHARVPEP